MEKLYRIRLNSPESIQRGVSYYLLVNVEANGDTPQVREEVFPESEAQQLRAEYVKLFKPDYSLDLEEAGPLPENTNYVEWQR